MQTKLETSRSAVVLRPIAVSCIAMISLPLSMNFGILASTVFGTYLMVNTLFGAYAYIRRVWVDRFIARGNGTPQFYTLR